MAGSALKTWHSCIEGSTNHKSRLPENKSLTEDVISSLHSLATGLCWCSVAKSLKVAIDV